MKYTFIVVIALFLGLCEYAFVGYYPLSPSHRVSKFQNLPVVKQVVWNMEKAVVERAIEESDSGFVQVRFGDESTRWTSAEDWLQDRKNRYYPAKHLVSVIKGHAEQRLRLPNVIVEAEEGDLSAMIDLYWMGRYLDDETVKEQATTFFESHPSALAAFYVNSIIKKNGDLSEREYGLLAALMSKENWRSPKTSDDQFEEMSRQNKHYLDRLYISAANGDSTAVWVVAELEKAQ